MMDLRRLRKKTTGVKRLAGDFSRTLCAGTRGNFAEGVAFGSGGLGTISPRCDPQRGIEVRLLLIFAGPNNAEGFSILASNKKKESTSDLHQIGEILALRPAWCGRG